MNREIVTLVCGEDIPNQTLCYLGADGKAYKANNSDPAKRATMYCHVEGDEDDTVQFYVTGKIPTPISADPGDTLYLHPTTPGTFTKTKPSGPFQFIGICVEENQCVLAFGDRNETMTRTNRITSTSSPQTLAAGVDNLIDQGSTQTAFTLNLPSSPANGDIVRVTFNNAITTLSVSGGATTVGGTTLIMAAIGLTAEYKYYSEASKWLRRTW